MHYNVPADNTALAPDILDVILNYAKGMGSYDRQTYLHTMLPQVQTYFGLDDDVIAEVRY